MTTDKEKLHHYTASIQWTGNKGAGTQNYMAYERTHIISVDNKPDIPGSADPAFRGDPDRYNPEELFIASLSACHMLWYLHLCAMEGIIVTCYTDRVTGIMKETFDGGGHFSEVTLHPQVTVADEAMTGPANALHIKARALCFIANSVNFPVHHLPTVWAE